MNYEQTALGMNQWEAGEGWNIVETLLQNNLVERMLLHGPPGIGKTHIAGMMGHRPGETVLYLTLTPDMPESKILGCWMPDVKTGGFYWKYGKGARAFKLSHLGPVTLVLNEIDHAGADAVSALHPILDDLTTAIIDLDNDETITKTSNLRIIACMNGQPSELLQSLASRFPISIHVDTVHPPALLLLPEDLRRIAAKTATSPDPEQNIDFRKWRAFANIRESLKDKISKEEATKIACKAISNNRWLELYDAIKTLEA